MKAIPILMCLALVAACAAKPMPPQDAQIQGFGSIKLGQSLSDARTALERDHLYYAFNGKSLDYQTDSSNDHWFVSAGMIKTRVANIVVSARPQMVGMPLVGLPEAECDRRFDRALDVLHHQYGAESSSIAGEEMVWTEKDRSITLRRRKIDSGCDVMSIVYDDHSVADRF